MLFEVVSWRGRFAALVSFLIIGLFSLGPTSGLASNSVTIAWDPSLDAEVVGYNVYYGTASGSYSNIVAVGNTTNATIPNLVAGTTYYIAATAVDSTGLESVFSNEAVFTNAFSSPPNQPPTLNSLPNLTINENASLQTVNLSGITSGATNEIQTLTVTATSSNPGLIPNPAVSYASPASTGSLSFAPAANASGSAIIVVTVNDGGASNNLFAQSFTVTVNPVNQPPTLNSLANLTINENAGLQTVNLSGITSGATNEIQTLTVTATSSNPGLIPNPAVSYASPASTGSISFAPVANASGSAIIAVAVNDGGASNNMFAQSFTVTVNPVNQPPTLNSLANLTINENAGLQTVYLSGITSGASNEVQTLTVTTTSSNPGLIPNPAVSYTSPALTGSLSFTPVSNAYGTTTITVTVNDGGASNNIISRSFLITVNQPPTISAITNCVIAVSSQTKPIPFTISDAESPADSLSLFGSSSNTALVQNTAIVFGGSGTNRTVIVTPLAGQSGYANITVSVSDGLATNSNTFQLSVEIKPTPPSDLRVAGP